MSSYTRLFIGLMLSINIEEINDNEYLYILNNLKDKTHPLEFICCIYYNMYLLKYNKKLIEYGNYY